jgi:5-(carboxyamino)imidazole ribonucleotide synthase
LGDLWRDGHDPNFAAALAVNGVTLHLYGKNEARPGRKMGHLTASAPTSTEALAHVQEAYTLL